MKNLVNILDSLCLVALADDFASSRLGMSDIVEW